jgi:NIMA (never in mitosis gene a)-related kinase
VAARDSNQPFTPQHCREWFVMLALGLDFVHKSKILHRDLKSENVFVGADNGTMAPALFVGDFGVSRVLGTNHSNQNM